MARTVCYKCFHEYDGDGACPSCGYMPGAQGDSYPLALQPGSILGGRYIVGRVLGQGGFGITYIAQDYDTKQLVAIKEHFPGNLVTRIEKNQVVLSSHGMEAAFRAGIENFLEEAKTVSCFNGVDNICDIYSYFEENGTAYHVMEYVHGIGLDEYIKNHGGKLSFEQAGRLLRPLMRALAQVHSKGIIHRDIAPDNIMVKEDGSVVLIDFGAARYSMGEMSRSLDVILKHGFAPREQYARHGRQGAYTDVYALAATFYYALSGCVLPDAMERTEKDELQPLSRLGVKLSRQAEQALMKALCVDYRERFQHMQDFEQALFAPAESGGRKKALPIAIAALGLAAGLAIVLMTGGKDKAAPVVETAAEPVAPEMSPLPAEESPVPSPVVESLSWEIDENGSLIISGEGAMTDYSAPGEAPWLAEKASIQSIVIGEGISYIGDYAFSGCSKLVSVSLPEGLQGIGTGAFADCSLLESVELPRGIRSLGAESFSSCWELSNISLPDTVETIGTRAFYDCPDLTKISIPASVKRLESGVFEDCVFLTEVNLTQGLEHIEDGAFLNCWRMPYITLPLSLESIGDEAFYKCTHLTTVYFMGSREGWDKLDISAVGNEDLFSAGISFYGMEN